MNEKKSAEKRRKVDWGSETADVFKRIGKVVLRIVSYIVNILLTVLLVGIIAGIIAGTAFAVYVKNYVDPTVDIDSLFKAENQSSTTRIYYMDFTDRLNRIGTPVELENERIYGTENKMYVTYDQIPKDMVNAIVSIEDKRFWDHHGVDWIRTLGAVKTFFLGSDEFSGGGSTITQQLIKNATQNNDYTIQRKVQEIFSALNLEKQKSKEDILEMYLNIVPFSQNCNGVQAAAWTYFGKTADQLSLLECAALAAIPNSPSSYDPITHPDNNKKRRNYILDKMLEFGKITQEQHDENYDAELVLNVQRTNNTTNVNSYYVDMAIQDVIDDLMEQKGVSKIVANQMVYSGGLDIYILMDPEIQAIVDEVYADDSVFPTVTSGVPAQSSAVVIDPYTGDVVAVAGSRSEKLLNRAQNFATDTVRSPGSSLKPLSVYAPAIDAKIITYGTVTDDTPVNFGTTGTKAWPANYPAGYYGLTTVNNAIERSVNTISVKTLQKLTLNTSFNFVKNVLHMDSFIELKELSDGTKLTDKDIAALALGQLNYGVTVREITAAYGIFDNQGIYMRPKSYLKVLDSEGNIVLTNNDAGTIAISDKAACVMTKMLQNVVNNGTGRSITLRYSMDVAGKTGTTSNDFDRWFLGYTPYYVCGVWYGYEYPKSLSNLSSNPSNKIWDTLMTKIHQKYIDAAKNGGEPLKTFTMATGVIQATYCKDSGMLVSSACQLDPRGNRAEVGYFIKGTEPTEYCDVHVAVAYDNSTGGVASAGCTDVSTVGLIKVTDRSFPIDIIVGDAQYVYRPLSKNVAPGDSDSVPFFVNMLDEGEYVGHSYADKQFNAFCYQHFDFAAFNAGLIDSAGNSLVAAETTTVTATSTTTTTTTQPASTTSSTAAAANKVTTAAATP